MVDAPCCANYPRVDRWTAHVGHVCNAACGESRWVGVRAVGLPCSRIEFKEAREGIRILEGHSYVDILR